MQTQGWCFTVTRGLHPIGANLTPFIILLGRHRPRKADDPVITSRRNLAWFCNQPAARGLLDAPLEAGHDSPKDW
jgi:hypothetical protein